MSPSNNPFGKEKANNVYFKVKDGEIVQRHPEPEGWDGKCDFVTGVFTHFNYWYDEGNPSKMVEPSMVLDIWLTATVNGEAANLVISSKSPNTFTRMVASHMPNINVGDHIKMRVWPGTDNNKVSVCMIDRLDSDGNWQKVPRVELPKGKMVGAKKDTRDTDARVDEIFNEHPAFRTKQERVMATGNSGTIARKDEAEDPFAD